MIMITKGIKQAQCRLLCKKYDAMTSDYVWLQPTNIIIDPLDFMCLVFHL